MNLGFSGPHLVRHELALRGVCAKPRPAADLNVAERRHEIHVFQGRAFLECCRLCREAVLAGLFAAFALSIEELADELHRVERESA